MNLPAKIEKDTVFLIEDSFFNRYKTKEEMRPHLAILRQMAEQLIEQVPVSLELHLWPNAELLFMGCPPKDPVKGLYAVLAGVLSSSGFSIGVLTTLEVENHEPYDTTAIKAGGRFRTITIH